MSRFARNDGCEVTGLPRFPSVARNDEKGGKARLRVGTRAKSKKLSLTSSSPMREQKIIIFSVFLAEEECGLPRFARNDGCEVTGLPRFPSVARNDEKRGGSERGRDKYVIFVGKLVRGRDGGAIFVGKVARGRDEEECGLL